MPDAARQSTTIVATSFHVGHCFSGSFSTGSGKLRTSIVSAAAAALQVARSPAGFGIANAGCVVQKPSALQVLIVDDEPLICWSLAETLSNSGCIASEAGSGEAALHALAEASSPVDVVLLDYQLPDSDDLDLLATVKRLSPATHVVLMTAYGIAEIANEALARGACRVVAKPIDMRDVPALVREAAAAGADDLGAGTPKRPQYARLLSD